MGVFLRTLYSRFVNIWFRVWIGFWKGRKDEGMKGGGGRRYVEREIEEER